MYIVCVVAVPATVMERCAHTQKYVHVSLRCGRATGRHTIHNTFGVRLFLFYVRLIKVEHEKVVAVLHASVCVCCVCNVYKYIMDRDSVDCV